VQQKVETMNGETKMKKRFNALSLALGLALVMIGTASFAEQTIGVQAGATTAIATARVNVRVTVPKVVILRVGDANATVSDVNFTIGVGTGVPAGVGNSQAYTGAIAPAGGAVTVATTNPTTTAGVLTVQVWTNATAGAKLTCALTALAGATSFATGATAGGVPGTNDISVASTALHPTGNLAGCDGTSTQAATPRLTVNNNSFTYATTFTPSAINSGIYGNIATYSATTL
jgi:hypothetical protein